jgi:hypothetical protein
MTTASVLTDADLRYFYLGPLGYLRQLPLIPLSTPTGANEDLIGGMTASLDGTATLDVMGHRRTWQLSWVCLTPGELAAAHAMFQGLSRLPLRVIDPRAGNRLTRSGASGGSYSLDTSAHTVTAGTVAYAAVTDYPAAYLGLLDGGVAWSVPATTVCTLRVDAGGKIPLIPGETVSVGLLVKGTLNAQLGVQYYDVAGSAGSTALGTSVTLAGWAWLTYTFTPSAGQVSASLILVAASGAARTVTVGPGLWHPDSTDWCPGTGCPVVLPPAMTQTYPGLANIDSAITLREA